MKKLIFLILSLIFLVVPLIASAQIGNFLENLENTATNLAGGISDTLSVGPQSRDLEIEYPAIKQIPLPTKETGFPEYIRYIYSFVIVTSGIIALLIFMIGGVRYVASTGIPEKLSSAKEQMKAAMLGLLILVCSWIILSTVNPHLVVLRDLDELPALLPDLSPGVYLCTQPVDIEGFWQKRQSAETKDGDQRKIAAHELTAILDQLEGDSCIGAQPFFKRGDVNQAIEDKIRHVYLVPRYNADLAILDNSNNEQPDDNEKRQYGVILYEERGEKGKGRVIYGDTSGGGRQLDKPTSWTVSGDFGVSSAVPFILNHLQTSDRYAEIFELVFENRDDLKKEKDVVKCELGGQKISTWCQLPKNKDGKNEIGSVAFEGDVFMVFFKDSGDWTTESEIYVETHEKGKQDMGITIMDDWNPEKCVEKREPELRDRYYPCAEKAVLIGASFY